MVSFAKLNRYARIFYDWQIRKNINLSSLPEEVSIEATNVCNFRCEFCPQSDPMHHEIVPRTYLSPENAKEIFRRLRSGGILTRTLHWTLDGEPFMNRQFNELCATAIEHGFDNMYFATNGMLLTPESIQKLPKGATYTFTIDYCADPGFFEEVRGTRGSWSRVRENIQEVLSDGKLQGFRFEIQDMSTFKISDQEEINIRFRNLQNLFSDKYGRLKIFRKTFHNATGLVEKFVNMRKKNKYHLCPYPWTLLNVASNGDVVACCRDLRRQTVLGNLFVQTLPEIWNGAAFQQLRRNLVDRHPERSAVCNGCDLPYDDAKFSVRNLVRTAVGRLQVFH